MKLLFASVLFFLQQKYTKEQLSLQRDPAKPLHFVNFLHLHRHRLNVTANETLEVDREIQCTSTCLKKQDCFSFNVEKKTGGKFLCEFLNTSKYIFPENLIKDNNFVHWYLQDSCLPSPCMGGYPCKAVSSEISGYLCDCPTIFGKRCNHVCKYPEALGMESGKILDSQITASSEVDQDVYHGPKNARLNFKSQVERTGAWSSQTNDGKQWLQIDFMYRAIVTEILTQGRNGNNQWVKTYTVSYSVDGVNFKPYRHGGLDKVFQGNTDSNTIVRQSISPVIVARYIRIHPKTWAGHTSMRAEFIGCIEEMVQ